MDFNSEINARLINFFSLHNRDLASSAILNELRGIHHCHPPVEEIIDNLTKDKTLAEKESSIWKLFSEFKINGAPFEKYIAHHIAKRQRYVFNLISPYIVSKGTIADFGAGSGRLMRLIASEKPCVKIEGWDIVNDDPKNKIEIYDGKKIPRPDSFYDQTIAITSLHHSTDPARSAAEIVRISKKSVILFETILRHPSSDHLDQAFIEDYIWRLLNKSSEPIPCLYKTSSEWIRLFTEDLGCKFSTYLNQSENRTDKTGNVLIVFEKK